MVRTVSQSVVDLNNKAESLFEGFPSLRSNNATTRTSREEEITMDIQEDDDKSSLSTKILAYHKEPIEGRIYSESVDFFETSPKHSNIINTSKEVIPELKFVDEIKLSNFENKIKKRYNAVLTLDERDEDDDEMRNFKKLRDKLNKRKKSEDDIDPVLKFAYLDHEEADLYRNYCNMIELDGDNIFTQEEENQIRREIQSKLDVSINSFVILVHGKFY